MDTEHALRNAAGGRGRPGHAIPDQPAQQLPRDAYVDRAWFERERRDLFGCCWTCAGVVQDLAKPGEYVTVSAGDYPLMVLRDGSGTLRAFHNLCRHRGTELVEGSGRLERARISCPYHRWTYDLDGSLRAVPMRARCFADLDTDAYSLRPAAIGELGGLIFVNPDPHADFVAWRADLESVLWPHRFERMSAGLELTYEIHCNWKVFLENAIDGYHLAYLHSETLGGPRADRNVWDVHGRHLVWYSTETGRKTCLPEGIARAGGDSGQLPIEGAESGEYGGVFVLFPNTIVTATPTELIVSRLDAVTADLTHLHTRVWGRKGGEWRRWLGGENVEDIPGYDPASGLLRLSGLEQHPLEIGDFHWEDVWICEKLQRSLRSPAYRCGPLAAGTGAEGPLEFFQRNVLDYLTPVPGSTQDSSAGQPAISAPDGG